MIGAVIQVILQWQIHQKQEQHLVHAEEFRTHIGKIEMHDQGSAPNLNYFSGMDFMNF